MGSQLDGTGAAALVPVAPEPGSTTVCLVRHGETDWNAVGRLQGREDVPLNARGREQALASARMLAGHRWDAVVSSPLRRAWETATIIGAELGTPPLVAEAGLVERDYGAASGLTRAEIDRRYPDGAVPGRESLSDVADRVLPVLESCADRWAGGSVVVVAHGGVISTLLRAASAGAVDVVPGSLRNACLSVLHQARGVWGVAVYGVVAG